MRMVQLRNATIILDFGGIRLLVDPMLTPKGKIPPLKYATFNQRRNPLTELPKNAWEELEKTTHVLVTHCQKGHFDHLDRAAIKWIRQRGIEVLCPDSDGNFLAAKGLKTRSLSPEGSNFFKNGEITLVRCVHGKGVVGKMMAHGYGYVLKMPGEPVVYLTGDTILTEEVKNTIFSVKPDIVVMPGGGARFDIGSEIIMGLEDILPAASLAHGIVVVNHLEALDHCPVTRKQVKALAREKGLKNVIAPADGEVLVF